MSKIAFIFPRTGEPSIREWAEIFTEQTETGRGYLTRPMSFWDFLCRSWCFGQNDRLDITERYTRAAMVTTSIAMMKVFTERTGIRPDVAAGLSLGEYCALAAAGVMSDADAPP